MIKNLLFIFLSMSLAFSLSAQEYQDDFESYDVGAYIGNESPSFTTWSGTTGGAEDAQVVDDKAKSGTKSIYFYSTTSGPQDVVVDFGAKYTTGTFDLSFSVWMDEGSEAYWNIQEETTIGVTWASNTWLRNDGIATTDGGGTTNTSLTTWNQGEWNDFEYNIDLDNNEWVIKMNGVCVGTILGAASVASLDLFPLTTTGLSEFWIDDMQFKYTETPTVKSTDVALSAVGVDGAAFSAEPASILATLTNTATELINDVKVVAVVEGVETEKVLTDLNMAAGESMMINFEDVFTPATGLNVIEINVTEVNGFASDDAPCNNTALYPAVGVNPTPNKRVVVEEGTGTWCPWCPRGAVFLDRMEDKYDERFIGIAVHNGGADPMVVPEYDAFMAFSGYPNVRIERVGGDIDPSGIEGPLVEALQDPINETFDITATFDETTRELVTYVEVTAINNLASARDIMVVVTEDNVTGTSSAYAQANAYAGNQNGEMGGYENLPSPVPASQMVYDHVARAILPAPGGMDLGVAIAAGDSEVFQFSTILADDVDPEYVHLVAMVTAAFPAGKIDNAYDVKMSDVLFVSNKEIDVTHDIKITPNPADNVTFLRTEFEETSNVSMEIYSLTGQLVASQNYGKLQGDKVFTINTVDFTSGIYNVVLIIDGHRANQKIVVTH